MNRIKGIEGLFCKKNCAVGTFFIADNWGNGAFSEGGEEVVWVKTVVFASNPWSEAGHYLSFNWVDEVPSSEFPSSFNQMGASFEISEVARPWQSEHS